MSVRCMTWCQRVVRAGLLSGKRQTDVMGSYVTASHHIHGRIGVRNYTEGGSVMSAWQVSQYGGVEELYLNPSRQIPQIRRPDELLIRVHAASVNPFDTMMIAGYGATTINPFRLLTCNVSAGSEFPLTPGRDFSGVVVDTGKAVPSSKFKVGDEVWGAIPAHSHGTHAQYTIASALEISRKPKSLSHIEAASLPYVAATTWAAVCTVGWMTEKSTRGKQVLVLGGAGGLGTFAIQLFKAWGAEVTTTCSTDAVTKLLELGADNVIDYHTQDVEQELRQLETGTGFDYILDAVGKGKTDFAPDLLKSFHNATYTTICIPFLKNNDQDGLPVGLAKSAISAGIDTIKNLKEGKNYRWAVFLPNGHALGKVAELVDAGKIRPVLDGVFSFSDVPKAYSKVMEQHNRGKTVIDVIGERMFQEDEQDTEESAQMQSAAQ